MKKKRIKKIPEFENEEEERAFWDEQDVVDYFDWGKSREATFPDLKRTTRLIPMNKHTESPRKS